MTTTFAGSRPADFWASSSARSSSSLDGIASFVDTGERGRGADNQGVQQRPHIVLIRGMPSESPRATDAAAEF
eukprot:1398130-Prymnesium_polylepis.1